MDKRGLRSNRMRSSSLQISVALVMAVLLVAGQSASLRAQQPGAPTSVRVYAAFGPGALRPGVEVIDRVSGECFAASVADQSRDDAWRCMTGNRILDPCFAGFQGAQPVMACPENPWTSRVVLLTPTKAPANNLANQADIGGGLPWALELRSGIRCVFLTGATAVVAGMRINYGCVGNAQAVVGDVNRALPEWRVFVDRGQGVVVELEGVAAAWY